MIKTDRAIWKLCLTFAAVVAAAVSATAGSHALRIPAGEAEAVYGLGLQPLHDLDYGSFRWLVVDDAALARIEAAGIPHTEVAGAMTVQVQGFRFDPVTDGEPAIPDGLRASGDRPGLQLVQLIGPVRDEWIAALAASGVRLLEYYPHNAYLVWSDPATMAGLETLPFVRWQGAFHPAYRLGSSLEGRSGTIRNVDVMLYDDGGLDDAVAGLEALGAVVLRLGPAQPDRTFFNATIEVGADRLHDIARMGPVLWLGYASPKPVFDDEMSDQIVAGNYVGGVPFVGYLAHLTSLGFDGSGVIWATIDSGVDWDHPDLSGHIAGGYDFPGACSYAGQPGSDCPNEGHGTHVTGIIGGDGSGAYTDPQGFVYGLGVAPGYSIFAMNPLSSTSGFPDQEYSKRALLGSAIGGNSSWGYDLPPGYTSYERLHDFMVRDGLFDTGSVAEPFIEVFSAGNEGPGAGTMGPPKQAKNLITIGASQNYRIGNIDAIASYSSRGPAVDGRWLPTIAAPGSQIASARNDLGFPGSTLIAGTSNLYAYASGTSMAAPHASGVVAIAAEWWRTFNGGADPSPAMVKALLVNSAVDMASANIPNNSEGWGRANVTKLVSPGVPREYWDQTDIFGDTGGQIVIAAGVPDPGQPLKVTLAWTDRPGAIGANPALVNNLDLTVATGGDTYLGNVFSGGWSTTGGGADALNNLENVYVQTPGSSVIITIDATAIVGDGIPYNGDTTDQDFALVCTNCELQPDFYLQATPDSAGICAGSDAQYTVNVGAIGGFVNPVTMAANGHPAGTTASFTPNPVTPPGTSLLTVGSTGGAAAGSYAIIISGTASGSGGHDVEVVLEVVAGVAGPPTLVAPADGSTDQPLRPDFEWTAVTGADSYALEVDDDPAFGSPAIAETGIVGTSFTPGANLDAVTTYHWRVSSENLCGTGATSIAFSFTTGSSLPFADGFESGDTSGWSVTVP